MVAVGALGGGVGALGAVRLLTVGALGSGVPVRLLLTVGSLGLDVRLGGVSLVRGSGCFDTKVSLGSPHIKGGLGAISLSLSLGGSETDIGALVGLLDLGCVVVVDGGLGPGLTTREGDLRALVAELGTDLVDGGSLERVVDLGAVGTEGSLLGCVAKLGLVDIEVSLGAIDTKVSLGAIDTVFNSGLVVLEGSV